MENSELEKGDIVTLIHNSDYKLFVMESKNDRLVSVVDMEGNIKGVPVEVLRIFKKAKPGTIKNPVYTARKTM